MIVSAAKPTTAVDVASRGRQALPSLPPRTDRKRRSRRNQASEQADFAKHSHAWSLGNRLPSGSAVNRETRRHLCPLAGDSWSRAAVLSFGWYLLAQRVITLWP